MKESKHVALAILVGSFMIAAALMWGFSMNPVSADVELCMEAFKYLYERNDIDVIAAVECTS